MQTNYLRTGLTSAVVVLAACSSMEARKDVSGTVDEATSRAQIITDQTVERTNRSANVQSQQEVAAPWIAGKSVSLAKEVTVPPVLRRRLNLADGAGLDALGKTRITALSAECNPASYTLTRLASCVTAFTGLPVRVKPDALLPASAFAMRSGGASGASASGPALTQTLTVAPIDMQLSTLLEMASATWAVKYRRG